MGVPIPYFYVGHRSLAEQNTFDRTSRRAEEKQQTRRFVQSLYFARNLCAISFMLIHFQVDHRLI